MVKKPPIKCRRLLSLGSPFTEMAVWRDFIDVFYYRHLHILCLVEMLILNSEFYLPVRTFPSQMPWDNLKYQLIGNFTRIQMKFSMYIILKCWDDPDFMTLCRDLHVKPITRSILSCGSDHNPLHYIIPIFLTCYISRVIIAIDNALHQFIRF